MTAVHFSWLGRTGEKLGTAVNELGDDAVEKLGMEVVWRVGGAKATDKGNWTKSPNMLVQLEKSSKRPK